MDATYPDFLMDLWSRVRFAGKRECFAVFGAKVPGYLTTFKTFANYCCNMAVHLNHPKSVYATHALACRAAIKPEHFDALCRFYNVTPVKGC